MKGPKLCGREPDVFKPRRIVWRLPNDFVATVFGDKSWYWSVESPWGSLDSGSLDTRDEAMLSLVRFVAKMREAVGQGAGAG